MKSTLFVLAFFASLLHAQEPPVPRPATDFGFQTGPDQYTWLSEYKGKTCVVAFILTTCPHCQYTTGILTRIQKEYAARGVQVLESAIDPMASLRIADFRKKLGVTFPVGYNEQNYGLKFLGLPENTPMLVPQIVMIDAKGIIRVQYSGDSPRMKDDIQEKSLREDLEKTIKAGQTAAGRTTQSGAK